MRLLVLCRLVVCVAAGSCLVGCGGGSSQTAKAPDAPAQAPREAAPTNTSDNKAATNPPQATKTLAADLEAEYDKGAALAAAGQFQEARAVFEAAAPRDPQDGVLAAGVAIFRELEERRVPEGAVQRVFRAFEYANKGQWTEAHADMDEAIKLAPEYARGHAARGTLLIMQNKLQDAAKAFDRAVTIDPQFAEGYYNRGATLAELEQYDAAIRDYTRAIEIQPDFAAAYRNRGSAYLNRGAARKSKEDAISALSDYTKAHELHPRAVEPLFLRGVLYTLGEEWDAAAADFTEVIARDPNHAQAYYNRGLAYQNQGSDDRALADYTRTIEKDATGPAPFVNRGLLYARRKQYDLAIADYDKALAVAPNLAVAYFNKAQAFDQAGRPQEAAAVYRTFLEKAGTDDASLASQARQRLAALDR